MTHDTESEISRAIMATSLMMLGLMRAKPSLTRGSLTRNHRDLLANAATCFLRASELLGGLVEESDRLEAKEPKP